MTTNAYIQVKNESEGTYTRIKVLNGSWQPATVALQETARTLNGKLSLSVGSYYYVYAGVAKVSSTDSAPYATTAKFREWGSSTDIDKRRLQIIDHLGNGPTNVFMISPIAPEYLDPMLNLYYIPFTFESR